MPEGLAWLATGKCRVPVNKRHKWAYCMVMLLSLSFSDRKSSKRQSAKHRYKILKKVSNNVMV